MFLYMCVACVGGLRPDTRTDWMTVMWTSLKTLHLETKTVLCLGVIPTINCGLVQGVRVDLVVVIGHEHPSVCVPVVPQHPGDGRGEVGQLKARVRRLRGKHKQTTELIFKKCLFLMKGPACKILRAAWYLRWLSDGFAKKQWRKMAANSEQDPYCSLCILICMRTVLWVGKPNYFYCTLQYCIGYNTILSSMYLLIVS